MVVVSVVVVKAPGASIPVGGFCSEQPISDLVLYITEWLYVPIRSSGYTSRYGRVAIRPDTVEWLAIRPDTVE